MWRAIICRFGIPRALVSDNGKQFDNAKFRDFCAELRIKNYYSSPAHPQSNGQAEVTIRTLKAALKTKLEDLKGNWVEYLPEVLWAYRTTQKSATRETPFALAFGTEAVAPVEIGIKSPRIELASEEHNDEALRLNLELLDEKSKQVQRRTEEYQRKTSRYYNQRVKPRSYMPGDLVLKKLLPSRKNPTHGKLGPTGKALTSYPESSDQAITNSKQKREKSCSIHGIRNILSVFTNKRRFVIEPC